MDLRVAVVGAGPAGLAALKALSEAGFDVTCFEKGDRVGGIWAFENSSGLSAAYRTLHLNTSKARTEFAAFPMPDSYPDFPSHEHIAAWLDAFVDHFGLRERIRFEMGVARAERGDGWTLTLDDGTSERFDALVVANGHNWDPRLPEPAPPGSFAGTQIHAHDFRDNAPFERRRVLVVGMGNSAMDIAVEASWVAERTLLSVRSGSHVVPKYLFGKPADQITSPLVARRVPWRLRQALSQALLRVAVGRPEAYGLPAPSCGFLQDHPTISDTILSRLTHGEVEARPGVAELDGHTVRFADGSADEVDLIVWCTGYRVVLPFLDPALLGAEPDELPLYQRIFHPDVPDLFFVGLVQSTGSALPIVERQAAIVAEHLLGRYALPPREARLAHSARHRRAAARRYGEHKRPALRVEFDRFMHDLERELERGRKRARSAGFPLPVAPRPEAARA